jgi:hypothetical protein
MITSFEVGAVFKIINEASPTLSRILKQIRELNAAIDKARENLALLGKSVMPPGLPAAVTETTSLAEAWGAVAKNAASARIAIGNASAAARALPPTAAGAGGGRLSGGGGGAGRHQPGFMGRLSGGAHVAGPGVSIPGGSHMRFGGGAMAGAGLLGYGVYQAAQMEDAIFQLIYHSGLEQNDANRGRFRKVIEDAMAESGYGLHDISESAKQEIRMFQGTKGGGLDVLPEMLRAATIEARLKGESPEESIKALIGLAHMTKQYDPAAIRKLAPAFAFLSTANPGSLSSIERAAGYAVPLLQSGLDIDPMQSLLLGTALTRAGATSTKSGTWLREMALRAMPGTSLMSKMAYKKHEAALKEVGLSDDKGNPTWFTDGKPDLLKMLDIGGAGAAKIPVTRRAAIERSLFGAQGGGGFALLADPAVREQVQSLMKEMNSPEFKNRYGSFSQTYTEGSTMQQARTAMADFSITMGEIGKTVLPSVNQALHDFKNVLESIRGVLPGAPGPGGTSYGARAIEGAAAGALIGSVVPGVGTLGGGVIGGVLGVAEAYMENDAKNKRVRPGDRYAERRAAQGLPALVLSLNIDGRTIAQAMSDVFQSYYNFSTGAATADGVGIPLNPDHNTTDH